MRLLDPLQHVSRTTNFVQVEVSFVYCNEANDDSAQVCISLAKRHDLNSLSTEIFEIEMGVSTGALDW